jgi:hypothetical protein
VLDYQEPYFVILKCQKSNNNNNIKMRTCSEVLVIAGEYLLLEKFQNTVTRNLVDSRGESEWNHFDTQYVNMSATRHRLIIFLLIHSPALHACKLTSSLVFIIFKI